MKADLILTNGIVFPAREADSIAINGDRILAVARSDEIGALAGEGTETIDLEGRPVLPGFIDAHVHLFDAGLREIGWRVDLSGLSRDETLAALREAVKSRGEGEWVIGEGWDESRWGEPRYLTRGELDRVAPDSPLGAVRMDGHMIVLNRVGLRAASSIVPDHGSDLFDPGKGILREEAAWTLLERIEPDPSTLAEALSGAARLCHRLGVTSVHTMTKAWRVPILFERRGRDLLRIGVYQTVGSPSEIEGIAGYENDQWLRFLGVKVFTDGSIGAGTAAVTEAYPSGGNGILNYTDEEISNLLAAAARAGHQAAIHAIGDRAIAQVLRMYARLDARSELRNRIEHFELPEERQIEEVKRLGLHLSMQPNFIGNWSGPGKMYVERLGRERDAVSNPLRAVFDFGIPVAFGSDGMPISPLYGIRAAVNAPYSTQRVSLDEAIAAYTEGGARFGSEEGVKGRIEEGFLADLVVLNEDPFLVPTDLNDMRVEMTFVGGKLVYAREGRCG